MGFASEDALDKLSGPIRFPQLPHYGFVTSLKGIEAHIQGNSRDVRTLVVSVGLDQDTSDNLAINIHKLGDKWQHHSIVGVKDMPKTYLIEHVRKLRDVVVALEEPTQVIFHCIYGQSRSVFCLAALLILDGHTAPGAGTLGHGQGQGQDRLGDTVRDVLGLIKSFRAHSINPGFVVQLLLIEGALTESKIKVKKEEEEEEEEGNGFPCCNNCKGIATRHVVELDPVLMPPYLLSWRGMNANEFLQYDYNSLIQAACDDFWKSYRDPLIDRKEKQLKVHEKKKKKMMMMMEKMKDGKDKNKEIVTRKRKNRVEEDEEGKDNILKGGDFPILAPVGEEIHRKYLLCALPPGTTKRLKAAAAVASSKPGCVRDKEKDGDEGIMVRCNHDGRLLGFIKEEGLSFGGYFTTDVVVYDRTAVVMSK